MKLPACFSDHKTKDMIRGICDEYGLDLTLIQELYSHQMSYSGSGRKEGIYEEFNSTIDLFIKRIEN